MWKLSVILLVLLSTVVPGAAADVLKGDEAKDAKDRLKDVKKNWKTATKADKLVLLRSLERLPEKTVGHFLEDVIADDPDDLVAERAAWALVRHGDPEDGEELHKLFKKATTPGRKAACLRWLGRYADKAPVKDLRKYALDEDASAEAATLALADINTDEAWNTIEVIAQTSKQPLARRTAVARLLARPDKRGVDALGSSPDLEEAAWAAHFAIGNELETDALKKVLEFTAKTLKLTPGKRPQYFGSLLGRLTKQESHEAVVAAAATWNKLLDVELGWWLISHNRANADYAAASRWLKDEDKDDILNGLRYLQRLPEPLTGDSLKLANEHLKPLLENADDDIAAHALFTCVAAGACKEELERKIEVWVKEAIPYRRAAALLAAGQAGIAIHANRAIELLDDECWYVQSAALDCLLHLRPGFCADAVLVYAARHMEGRMFSEAIALLVDLTGQDFGDLLDKWETWLKANPKFEVAKQKLASLRGVPNQKLKQKTGATFYGLEISSTNVQFALDRSVSMVNPVTREPERQDYADRKADILKRRPEVNRMVRDGFLPRFYVAAAEVSGALDGLSQSAKFGITLFNHEHIDHPRVANDLNNRKDAVNWMLSTDVQGGTDIKVALLSIIDAAEADTILLLSDGEPMSLSILEMISRANTVKRVNIMVVSIHKDLSNRHYLDVLATRDYGKIVDAEPKD
jgi:HEAT repeat protein